MKHIKLFILATILLSCNQALNENNEVAVNNDYKNNNDSNDTYLEFDHQTSWYLHTKLKTKNVYKGSYFSEIPYYFLQEQYDKVIYNKHLAKNKRDSALVGISYLKHKACDTLMFKLYYENIYSYRSRWHNPYYYFMAFYSRNHFNLELPHETVSAIKIAHSNTYPNPSVWLIHRVFYISHFEDIMKHNIHRGGLLNLIDILQEEASTEDLPEYTIDPASYGLYNKDILYITDYLMGKDSTGEENWNHYYKYNALMHIADPDWDGDLDSLLSSFDQKTYSREEYLYFSLKLLNAGKVMNLEKRESTFNEKKLEIYQEILNELDSIPLKFVYYFLDNDDIDICKLHHKFVKPTECDKVRDVFLRNYFGKKCAIKNKNCTEIIEYHNGMQSQLNHLPKYLKEHKENLFNRLAEHGLSEYEQCLKK